MITSEELDSMIDEYVIECQECLGNEIEFVQCHKRFMMSCTHCNESEFLTFDDVGAIFRMSRFKVKTRWRPQ